MGSLLNNTLFFIAALALGFAVLFAWPTETPTGMVAKAGPATDKPYVQLLAPDDDSNIYGPVQTYAYRVENVDYDARCGLMTDGEPTGDESILAPGQLGTFKTELEPGRHTWRIECQLLNGRTIASPDWTFNTGRYPESSNEATGMAPSFPEEPSDGKGVFLALFLIAGMVWIANWSRKKH